jgi:zinc-binding alcohol dehydrogenase family protein
MDMKAILARHDLETRDSGTFIVAEQPVPEPGANDLLVKIEAVGMNPVDYKARTLFGKDLVLGWDACGVVEKTGAGVAGFQAGDRVYYAGDITKPGCNAEYQLVDHRITAKAPAKLSAEDAAAMPLTTITAWEGLFDRLGFKPTAGANAGKSVLIIGGAGGVGSVTIQLARWAGLKVIATASRPDTIAWCTKLGADVVINHRNPLDEELKAADIDGVDAIFCTGMTEQHWNAMAECVRPQGGVVLIDDPSGPMDITVFKMKSVSLSWEFKFTRSMFGTEDIADQGVLLTKVAELLDGGTLVTTRQETLSGLTPENIQAMHVKQESGAMMGKQVLTV